MRIVTHSVTTEIVNRLQQLNAQTTELHKKASTGRKVELGSDDPAVMSRTLENLSDKRSIQQYGRTQNYAEAVSAKSYSVLERLQQVTNRAQEIAQMGGAVLNDDHFIAYAEEVDELVNEVTALGNSTHQGQYLFSGTDTGNEPMQATTNANGEISSVTYGGNADDAEVYIGKNATVRPRLEAAQNSEIATLVNRLVTLRDELRAGNDSGVAALHSDFLDAEDDMIRALGNLSASRARIETARALDEEQYLQLTKTIAAETEVDLPSTLVELTQAQNAYQAAMRGGASILQMSMLDYL